jgi:hypothetical protein
MARWDKSSCKGHIVVLRRSTYLELLSFAVTAPREQPQFS